MKLGQQFAAVINARLAEMGWSQADLAREMGVTPKHINQMLTGKATGSPGMLDYAAHVLGFEWSVQARDNARSTLNEAASSLQVEAAPETIDNTRSRDDG